jgi:phage terminase large subunit-like protein
LRGADFAEKRRQNGIKYYIPNPGNQEEFHRTIAKIRGLFGGNRSGKTHAGAAEAALFATCDQRYRSRPIREDIKILVGSESNEYNRDIIVPKLRRLIPKSLIVKETRIQRGFVDFWELPNGGLIKFKNYEQEADKWAGDDYDFVWLDEEPPYDIFKEVLLRTVDRGGEIVLTMTPIKGVTYVYTDIYEKDGTQGIKCFIMDMDENEHLGQKEKDLVLANLTEQEKKIRKEGKFVALHGLIYPSFNEGKHCIEPFDIPQDWRKVVSVDPHLKKDSSALWAAVAGYNLGRISKGDWVVYRELRRGGIIQDIVASVQVASGRERLFARIGDPALNFKDNITGVNPFDEFASAGFPLIPANKKVESGVYAVRELLDQDPPGLWIFDTCIGLVWEFRHYVYADIDTDQRKSYSEKIKKRDDDYMDCLRYIINSGIGAGRSTEGRPQPKYSETGRYLGVSYG